jgi:hypothetical protein
MLFLLWTRQQLLKILRLVFLIILLVALVFGVYGLVKTGEVMANRARDSCIAEKKPVAAHIVAQEKSAGQNLFERLVNRLKGYYRGDL